MKRSPITLALAAGLALTLFSGQANAARTAQPAMRIASVTASPRVVIRQGVVTFRVHVTGMKLDIRHMGKHAVAGHGHLQYYLDSVPGDAYTRKDLRRTFLAAVATPLFSFNLRASRVRITPGSHRIIVALARNDDILYRSPTSAISIFSFNFAPKSWALCNGQLLPINQNQALFALLGTTYGGNGQTTFALPNLRGRVQIHRGNGHTLGEQAGSSAVTINQQTMPQHFHVANAINQNATTNDITDNSQNDALLAQAPTNFYNSPSSLTSMNPGMVTSVGGSQPHTNQQPYLTINFSIALQGIFPSQN